MEDEHTGIQETEKDEWAEAEREQGIRDDEAFALHDEAEEENEASKITWSSVVRGGKLKPEKAQSPN